MSINANSIWMLRPHRKAFILCRQHTKKTLSTIPSYIKDTKAFINIIENLRIPQNALLVTVDVVGLYLNIPQKEGIERVIKYHYDKFPDEVVPKNHLRAFMQTILKHNIFHFAGKMFKQIKGTVMGTLQTYSWLL